MDDAYLAGEALELVLEKYPACQTVLDIGSGQGLHSAIFRKHLKSVLSLDASTHWGEPDLLGDFCTLELGPTFDMVWCSHTLEHQRNVHLFLKKIYEVLKPAGVLAITVPPAKPEIVGGHLTVWNAGLLLYNLILSGFDCRDAMVKQYDYNISVIVRKSFATLPPLKMDVGDIEKLSIYFPFPANQNFNGNVIEHNWCRQADPRSTSGGALFSHEMDIATFRKLPSCFTDDEANLLWSLACADLPGDVAEFGVFEGRSLKAMAAQQPFRRLHGFDSFRGLPEDWVRSDTSTYAAGHFSMGRLPDVDFRNVTLYPGFFEDSLPIWLGAHQVPLAMIHIDADLYSSALFVLDTLNALIVAGTVIVFDELCDWQDGGVYARWEDGEWKALRDWMFRHGRAVRLLSRCH
jgi:hypothetical protein